MDSKKLSQILQDVADRKKSPVEAAFELAEENFEDWWKETTQKGDNEGLLMGKEIINIPVDKDSGRIIIPNNSGCVY